MDDFINDLGGPKPRSLVEEAWHIEQNRKKFDIYRVSNPTNEDFYVEYDTNQHQRIPARSTTDVPHYIAIRYVQRMKDHLINLEAQQMHDTYLKERDEKGLPRYTDKYTENKETYETNPYPKTNDPIKIAAIYDKLWLGLVYEFGRDQLPNNTNPRAGEVDITPAEQKILAGMEKRRVAPEDSPLQQYQARPMNVPSAQPPPMPQQPTGFADLRQKLSPEEVSA